MMDEFVVAKAPAPPAAWPAAMPPMPVVDFAQFGEVEAVPLARNQKLVASFLARNWAQIPHVTHHDEARVDGLEAYRKQAAKVGVKLTPLPFLLKAAARALVAFPRFNASLAPDGNTLVMKRYVHIGVAVETPNGLLVPVIRDCDTKSIFEIATELAEKTERARAKGLPMAEMSGGCFSVSSLGAIGGTAFTPIINAPEVAILGVTRTAERLALVGGEVVSTLAMPLSLSYDHRVINGADAARFVRFIADQLAAPENLAR
jgi:pyruvate dehydrogenase E2 component (dihydrolipoamide acetyltransferase)